jgi:predicted O-methyltransferase YrrM
MTSQERWDAVDRYITDLFVPPDPVLDAVVEASAAAGLPPIQVPPNQGRLLSFLVTITRARRVLEIGTLGGYSTIWLARALPDGGRVVTLELEPTYADVARANLERAGESDAVEIRVGRAQDSLAKLVGDGAEPFDLIFIDADKASYAEYFERSLELSHAGTVIVADNVVRDGAVIDASSTDRNVQGVRRFNELVAAEPRVSATAIQTVGVKGYDGFAILLVN